MTRFSSHILLSFLNLNGLSSCESQQFLKLKQELLEFLESFLWSLWSFTCVSWRYLPSTDISYRPHFRCFLPFLCCYLFSKCNINFFILFLQILPAYSFHSFFSCVLLSLYSTFYLSLLFVFLCISSTFSFCLSCLSFTFLLCLLSFSSSSNFLFYHLSFLSASISFFVFYFPSLLSSTFILCLSSILSPLLLTLFFYFCTFVCVFCCCYYYYCCYHFYPPVLFFCFFYLFSNLELFLEFYISGSWEILEIMSF